MFLAFCLQDNTQFSRSIYVIEEFNLFIFVHVENVLDEI